MVVRFYNQLYYNQQISQLSKFIVLVDRLTVDNRQNY